MQRPLSFQHVTARYAHVKRDDAGLGFRPDSGAGNGSGMQKPAVHVVDCRLAGFMSDGLRTTSRENAVDESFRVEGREIVWSFAEADELDRHA